jgi:peptidylamidoglycolate lyase
MTIIKVKNCLFLFLALLLLQSCNNASNTYNENTGNELSKYKYELVKDWPQLSPGFLLSPVSGVGVDNQQNIFIFQRTGRAWTVPFPDSLISSNTIFLFDRITGKILNSWGSNLFIMPHGLTVDKEDNVWVTDVGLQQVFKFNHEGSLLLKLGVAKISGNDSLHFNLPTDVAVADDGSFYVSDGYGNSRVVKFSKEGKYLFAWGKKGNKQGEFNTPHMIDLDAYGNVFVADRENNRIQEFDANGIFLKEWKNSEATQLYAVAINKKNNRLFAIDLFKVNDTVDKGSDIIQFDSMMKVVARTGRTGSVNEPALRFHDFAIDDEENIYTCETGSKKIRKFKKVFIK